MSPIRNLCDLMEKESTRSMTGAILPLNLQEESLSQ